MKVDAQALYDYTARSDKELSFAKGDSLQVIEKTQDHNWWDGFHEGKRGYIPVAYVEILDLDPQSTLAVPAPPQRRSSMPAHDAPGEHQSPTRTSEPPSEPPIQEVTEVETIAVENADPGIRKTPDLVIQSPSNSEPPKPISVATPTAPESVPEEQNVSEQEQPKKSGGSVRLLKKQFQDQPQQQKVLVEPHSTHRRQHSTDNTGQRKGSDNDSVPRSLSGGNRVGVISSVFQNKPAPAPIPPKPKPRSHAPHPPVTSPSHLGGSFSPPDHQNQPPAVFPLMSHPQAGAGVTVSPLQRIVHQGQQKQPPAEAPKKPPPPGKSSKLKVKREKSFRTEKGPKPPPPAKPAIGYVAPSNKELNAELAARAARMKHQD